MSTSSPPLDAAEERARWVAKVARRFGCSMADVRAMTLRDVAAMDHVIRKEEADQERRRQAAMARRGRRR